MRCNLRRTTICETELFTAEHVMVYWVVKQRSLVAAYQRFGGMYCFHPHGLNSGLNFNMKTTVGIFTAVRTNKFRIHYEYVKNCF
jgi:hypothetical protein